MPQIIHGPPGESWTNDTGKVAFQFEALVESACGYCLQFHGLISTEPWPIPLHSSCRCHNAFLYPDKSSRPFADLTAFVRDLPKHRRKHVLGEALDKLVEKGVIDFEDAVSPTRVKPLREVVREQGLTAKALTDAGVAKHLAERAIADAKAPPEAVAATPLWKRLARHGVGAVKAVVQKAKDAVAAAWNPVPLARAVLAKALGIGLKPPRED